MDKKIRIFASVVLPLKNNVVRLFACRKKPQIFSNDKKPKQINRKGGSGGFHRCACVFNNVLYYGSTYISSYMSMETNLSAVKPEHLWIATTCLQRPIFWGSLFRSLLQKGTFKQRLTVDNGHNFKVSSVVVVQMFDCISIMQCIKLIALDKNGSCFRTYTLPRIKDNFNISILN